MPERYDEQEVQQILRLAMIRQGQDGTLLRSQLVEIAEELGISEACLTDAEEEWLSQTEEQKARQEFTVFRHQQLRQGIVRFIIVNSFLVAINISTAQRIDWAVYPVMIWGIAMIFQAWQVMKSEGENYDRAFRRWRLRQQIDASFKAISERFRLSWSRDSSDAADYRSVVSVEADHSLDQGDSSNDSLAEASENQSTTDHALPLDSSPTTILNQDSPTQKSRMQNRMRQRISSHHNRVNHFGASSSGDRNQGPFD